VKANLIYITAGSEEEARAIGRELVQSRLAACVNIIDHMKSMYWWEGKIQEEREVILIDKTKESLVPELVERVKSIHSYEVPCIVSFRIAEGNPSFLDWIAGETK
jgi:periplasmic divalent cation tolerance protein